MNKKTKTRSTAWTFQKMKLLKAAGSAFVKVHLEELRQGRLLDNIRAKRAGETNDISWAQLLQCRAARIPGKPFLLYRDETFTYRQMDERANQIAHFLLGLGYGKGKGLGIYMRNSPRFLDIFFGAQKIGMYLVPINPELKGDGLAYLINHSDIQGIVMDAELQSPFEGVAERLGQLKTVIVNDIEDEARL
jgi:crotonobetaine/carnitine-CoA ligase